MVEVQTPVGELLRTWRQRRRLSQLDLSARAEVSTRHLSFLETGRSQPSRQMLLHLAEQLEVPLRERNTLFAAAGYAPPYTETPLDQPAMGAVRRAIERLLASHEPYPALVVDRWWTIQAANESLALLTEGVAPALLEPPANALRASLHPDGLAPRIRNLSQWRAHLLTRLRGQVERTRDPHLADLLDELDGYGTTATSSPTARDVVVPLRLASPGGDLNFLSVISTFGTPADLTVADLSIEAFLPADEATRARLHGR
jgi:transcriptional regulator with XRE-family HTH domain